MTGTRSAIKTNLCLAVGTAVLAMMPAVTDARPRHSASTACLPASIKAALGQADRACGIKIISTERRGAVIRGTGGSPSMHRWCRAADFTTSDPRCVLRALAEWPGKLSTDYARVRHFHIDDGSYARFAHRGGRKHAARKAYRGAAQHRVSHSPQPALW